ncbi:MAG: hypothetical protein FJ126_02445 [Deltaproteobacteria bacterium]|nr:hypothetical protein [Deltaproteobacteria bacterium]
MTKNNLFKFIASVAFILILGGCAGVQPDPTVSFEQMLTTAGFRLKAADTPEKLARLQTLPTRRIVPRTKDGRVYYLFADPDQKALYVGDAQAYQNYLDLRMAKQDAEEHYHSPGERMGQMEMDYEFSMEMDEGR